MKNVSPFTTAPELPEGKEGLRQDASAWMTREYLRLCIEQAENERIWGPSKPWLERYRDLRKTKPMRPAWTAGPATSTSRTPEAGLAAGGETAGAGIVSLPFSGTSELSVRLAAVKPVSPSISLSRAATILKKAGVSGVSDDSEMSEENLRYALRVASSHRASTDRLYPIYLLREARDRRGDGRLGRAEVVAVAKWYLEHKAGIEAAAVEHIEREKTALRAEKAFRPRR